MSDSFYNAMWWAGLPAFYVSSRPVVVNAHVTRRTGAYILAANHQSPYDIPLLMRHCSRNIDFVSIVEVFQNPVVGALYRAMNSFPLDRSAPDSRTVRLILNRLSRGRVVGMFPEGQFRSGENSVLRSGRIRSGIGRLARLAAVPIIPCALLGSTHYRHPFSWAPLFRTRYAIAFGEPIEPTLPAVEIETRLVTEMTNLAADLEHRMASLKR